MTTEEMAFLRAFDAVAGCLRGFKQFALDAESRGDLQVELGVEKAWTAAHVGAVEGALACVVPAGCLPTAETLVGRLRIWERLARYAREMKAPEVELSEVSLNLHVREIWEDGDERALVAWESLRARRIGAQELPFQDGVAV